MEFSNRVRINLSQVAKSILKRDMLIFNTASSYKEGTFINSIIENYIASEFEISYEYTRFKGESKVYYLSDENVESLEYFTSNNKKTRDFLTPSELLKCIIESYCRLNYIERENIILHRIITQLNEAIQSKRKVTIRTYNDNITVSPYNIVPSREALFSYLVAYDGDKFNSFRISTIKSVTIKKETIRYNKSINLLKIDDLLVEFGPTFAFEPIENIIIQFLSDKAEQSYLYSSIHRPVHSEILDSRNKIYEFKCSLKQATYFFFRFAGNIKIISPKKLKDEFKMMYENGYKSCL